MKAILFVICGFFLANIVTATFIWPATTKASDTPAPVVNAAKATPRLPHTPFAASRMPVFFQRCVTMASPTG